LTELTEKGINFILIGEFILSLEKISQNPSLKLPLAILSTEQATGNYTHLLNNRVNTPIIYVLEYFWIKGRAFNIKAGKL